MYNNFENIDTFIEWVENLKRFAPKVSLDNMLYYTSLFNNPHEKIVSIHVTGTNGKGSVVSYLRSILMENKLHVATYTSPYITCFNERIMYDNKMISNEDLLRIANTIINRFNELENNTLFPTFFEFVTLIAFIYFSELKDLDIAIIEVGMGGRLDATNIIKPLMSIITNVSYDHMSVLGDTLEKILNEKLGIVKEKIPLICGLKDKKLIEQTKRYCEKTHSEVTLPLLQAFEIKNMDIYGSHFTTDASDRNEYFTPLAGFHQIENAILAISAIKKLNELDLQQYKFKSKIPVNDVVLKRGLANTFWPARLEIVNKSPLILLDGAHNIDGISRVMQFIKTLSYKKMRCVFACSNDKQKDKMIEEIDKYFDEIIFTAFSYKRHSNVNELANYSKHRNYYIIDDLKEVLKIVDHNEVDLTIFIGSLYLVSEVRGHYKGY